MQKKLIALAVAGLISGSASAQSNVTIYGLVDMGFESGNSGFGNKFRWQSGQSAGNRLGFKGEEDLGGGNKFIFVLESGFALDNGQSSQHGSLTGGASTNNPPIVNSAANVVNTAAQTGGSWAFSRQAFAGLKGNWGQFTFGRQDEPLYVISKVSDPFGAGTVAQAGNVFTGLAGFTSRLDNVGWYQTPAMSGFTLGAGYTTGSEVNLDGVAANTNSNFNGTARTAANRSKKEGQGYALMGQYAQGPLYVAIGYHDVYVTSNVIAIAGTATEAAKAKTTVAGVTYNFGMIKVYGNYGRGEVTQDGIAGKLQDNSVWTLSAAMPFGAHKIMAIYGSRDDKLAANRDFKHFGIGYEYALSKRTTFYGAWAHTNNDDRFTAAGVADGAGVALNSGSNTSLSLINKNYDPKALVMGVRHTF